MIWRGPILSGVIRQFYEQVLWSDLDYLLIDLPPGTSDAPLTVLQSLAVDGVVLVTMPQAAGDDDRAQSREPDPSVEEADPGRGREHVVLRRARHGHALRRLRTVVRRSVAELAGAPMLARLPIDPRLVEKADAGRVEEIDDPIVDELAAALERAIAATAQSRKKRSRSFEPPTTLARLRARRRPPA